MLLQGIKYLRLAERCCLVFIFVLMVGLFFLNVVAREMGGNVAADFNWIEDAVRFLNIYMVFGALGLALERGRHVGIDTFRDRLPKKINFVLKKVVDLTGLFFSLYLVYLGYGLASFILKTGQVSQTLGIPMGIIYIAPVIGFSLLAIRFFCSLCGFYNRFHSPEVVQEEN